jgi:hypothetical protein
MFRLKSFLRLFVVANLLLAGLLFPTLHFHLVDDHDRHLDGAHRHGVVHADFVAVLAHGHSGQANSHHDDVDADWPADGTDLLAVSSHRTELSAPPLHDQILLPDYDRLPRIVTISLRRGIIKNESPPHVPEVYSLASPRSPPVLV